MTIGYYGHGYPYFKGEDYLINPNGLTEIFMSPTMEFKNTSALAFWVLRTAL